jgi:hypothetical protein
MDFSPGDPSNFWLWAFRGSVDDDQLIAPVKGPPTEDERSFRLWVAVASACVLGTARVASEKAIFGQQWRPRDREDPDDREQTWILKD